MVIKKVSRLKNLKFKNNIKFNNLKLMNEKKLNENFYTSDINIFDTNYNINNNELNSINLDLDVTNIKNKKYFVYFGVINTLTNKTDGMFFNKISDIITYIPLHINIDKNEKSIADISIASKQIKVNQKLKLLSKFEFCKDTLKIIFNIEGNQNEYSLIRDIGKFEQHNYKIFLIFSNKHIVNNINIKGEFK